MINPVHIAVMQSSNSVEQTTYDFSGLNITRLYSFFKSNLATIDYACKVKNIEATVLTGDYYVFFDDNGLISESSPISLTTTPGALILSDLLDGDELDDVVVEDIFCQITGHSVTATTSSTNSPLIYDNGTFVTDNGLIAMLCKNGANAQIMDGTAISELDSGNDFSVATVSSNSASDTRGAVLASHTSSGNSLRHFNDRQSNSYITFDRSGGDQTTNTYLTQQDVGTQKRLVTTIEGGVEMKSYYNGTLQDTETHTDGRLNNTLRFHSQLSGFNRLEGKTQCFIIADTDWSAAQVTDLDSKLDNVYNF